VTALRRADDPDSTKRNHTDEQSINIEWGGGGRGPILSPAVQVVSRQYPGNNIFNFLLEPKINCTSKRTTTRAQNAETPTVNGQQHFKMIFDIFFS
jgi:hypothetical protein